MFININLFSVGLCCQLFSSVYKCNIYISFEFVRHGGQYFFRLLLTFVIVCVKHSPYYFVVFQFSCVRFLCIFVSLFDSFFICYSSFISKLFIC